MPGEFLEVLACDPPVSAQSGTEDFWVTVDEVVPSVDVYAPIMPMATSCHGPVGGSVLCIGSGGLTT